MAKATTAKKGNMEPAPALAELLDPAEIRAARQQQQAMIRAALGDQYVAWSNNRKKSQSF